MNQHDFKLSIFNQAHPDSILAYQDNVKVQYGDSLHTYYRYKLYEPIKVKGTIWIGITQKDDLPLRVGLDKNFAANNKIFWQVGNTWVNANVYGCLMIRPEFQRKKNKGGGIYTASTRPANFIYESIKRLLYRKT